MAKAKKQELRSQIQPESLIGEYLRAKIDYRFEWRINRKGDLIEVIGIKEKYHTSGEDAYELIDGTHVLVSTVLDGSNKFVEIQ